MLKDYEVSIEGTKKEIKEERDNLRFRIGALQRKIRELGIPVIILIDGWNSAGKGNIINELMIPLDPRNFIVYNEPRQTHEIRNRPLMYYYWTHSPAKGQIVTFDSSYYEQVYRRSKVDDVSVKKLINQIVDYENSMYLNGDVILKFFINISQKTQKKRLEQLENDPIAAFRASKKDWQENENYDKIAAQWEFMIGETNKEDAPWYVISGKDSKLAAFQVLKIIVEQLEQAIKKKESEKLPKLHPLIKVNEKQVKQSVLNQLFPEDVIPRSLYKPIIKEYQAELRELEFMVFRRRIPVMIAFEGFDAGGKGGAIKRVAKNLDPRGYRVYPSSAPTDVEKAHDWLWRYWNAVPKRGHFSIFDRTWYGRVLVEPIEGLCTEAEYEEAFNQIREFEKQLTDFGTVLLKFWMNISDEEQKRRFEEREKNPEKQWKITEEDWRNREKRGEYVMAAERMFEETSTKKAPWIIVNGDDKRYARTKVISEILKYLRKAINK